MIRILRQCLVNEYAPFITSNEKNFEDMAKKFLTPVHFVSEIGNSMSMAMTNVLSLPIAIFTGMQNMPIILVTQGSNVSGLAYEHTGTGHNYYLIKNDANTNIAPLPNATQPSLANKDVCCRCGQGAKKQCASFKSCKDYRPRCLCSPAVQSTAIA